MAFALPFVTALMLVQPVSATDVITDDIGDTPVWSWGADGTPFTNVLNSNPPMVQVEYLDMTAYSLSLEGNHYRFWMEVLVDLPDPDVGYVLPDGLAACEWLMFIDPGAYNPVYNPVVSLFTIVLLYDGLQYSAYVYDYGTGERTPLNRYGQSGSELWIEFPANIVKDFTTSSLWWAPCTRAYFGTDGTSWKLVDCSDYDWELATWDIPWPEV